MQKVVSSGKSVMDKIKEGVDLVVDPVKSTIGPLGRTVIISESYVADYGFRDVPIIVSKDGYRVSQHIASPDRQVQAGVLMVQQAAEKQMADAGDATSTCCLLTQAILEGGLKLIEDGASHVEVKNGIESAVEYVVSELKKMSTPIDGNVEKIRQIATVSANGDEVIGGLIAEAFSKIGVDGVINIEEAKGVWTSIKISDGIKFGRGWASPYFVTNRSKQECELVNPFILIYDRPVNILKDFMPILEQVVNSNAATGVKRPLMIFCDATDGEALATLTFNNAQGNLQSCVVEMAFLGQYKRDFMEDIAAATGGVFINELKGVKLENVKIEQLGQAKKVIVGKEETVIIEGQKDEKIFISLLNSLKKLEEKEEESGYKELLRKRIARLKGSVAILSVGAMTEVEMKEKKDRADDAVRATRSALEEGFVAGGGTAFIKIIMNKTSSIEMDGMPDIPAEELVKIYSETGQNLWSSKREFIDYEGIVYMALHASLKQICINAEIDPNIILKEIIDAGKEVGIGYNAKTGKVEDLIEAGIIEPTKSNRCALQNAASVVCAILTSQFLITDKL